MSNANRTGRIHDPVWQKLVRDAWNYGEEPRIIAERLGVPQQSVHDTLYRTGITFEEVKDRNNPIIATPCLECGAAFRQRRTGSSRRRWCSVACETVACDRDRAAKLVARNTPEYLALAKERKRVTTQKFNRLRHAVTNSMLRDIRTAKLIDAL